MKEIVVLRGARVLCEGEFVDADVAMQDGRIAGVGKNLPGDVVRVSGDLVPGLIDEHIHGIHGDDTMDGAQAVLRMAERLARHGVTSFLPTTMNAGVEQTRAAVRGVWEAMRQGGSGADIVGAHMEGPFLGETFKGAQDARANLPPTWENFETLTGEAVPAVRLITLAPELPGAQALTRALTARGIVVSAGHTDASYEQIEQAREWGVRQITHLCNGMRPLHHRTPGVVGAALTQPGLSSQLIADGIHLHPAMVRLAVRACERVLLISDSLRATDMPDGEYELGGQPIFVQKGVARIAAGNLAGSTLTLERGVRNVVNFAGVPLERAAAMASANVADALGLADRGRIRPGLRADLCLLGKDGEALRTWIAGRECAGRD